VAGPRIVRIDRLTSQASLVTTPVAETNAFRDVPPRGMIDWSKELPKR
jgi:hypothetical protein